MRAPRALRLAALPALALAAAMLTVGCPPEQSEYDAGFYDGFDDDEYYWNGFFDGYDTIGAEPILYRANEIPVVETPLYQSGYYDGLWYAYNDGYYSDYRYAFVIGFSEGYDNAYWPDYLDFLGSDQHVEYLTGGFDDGYNDGYSEGRVFGAYDYEADLPFDWLDALLDYESGTDLYFEEVDVGTGDSGPVVCYEHGTDPHTLVKVKRPAPAGRVTPKLREKVDENSLPLFRPLTAEAEDALDVLPAPTPRSDVPLALDTTWLERVPDYLDATGQKAVPKAVRDQRPPK